MDKYNKRNAENFRPVLLRKIDKTSGPYNWRIQFALEHNLSESEYIYLKREISRVADDDDIVAWREEGMDEMELYFLKARPIIFSFRAGKIFVDIEARLNEIWGSLWGVIMCRKPKLE